MTEIDPLMRIRTVVEVTAMSESTIRRKMKKGEFPAPVYTSVDTKGRPAGLCWRKSEIADWINKQPVLSVQEMPNEG